MYLTIVSTNYRKQGVAFLKLHHQKGTVVTSLSSLKQNWKMLFSLLLRAYAIPSAPALKYKSHQDTVVIVCSIFMYLPNLGFSGVSIHR